MGHADDPDGGARSGDGEGGGDGLLGADALERGVDADPAGQLEDRRVRFVAAGLDDVGGAEGAGQPLTLGVAAEGDDPLGAEPVRRQDGGQPDGAVTDDRDDVALLTPPLTAAWCPVDITSDRVSSDRSISSS